MGEIKNGRADEICFGCSHTLVPSGAVASLQPCLRATLAHRLNGSCGAKFKFVGLGGG